MHEVPALGRYMQEEHKFKDNMGYIEFLRSDGAI